MELSVGHYSVYSGLEDVENSLTRWRQLSSQGLCPKIYLRQETYFVKYASDTLYVPYIIVNHLIARENNSARFV